jgi:hypothetical protein
MRKMRLWFSIVVVVVGLASIAPMVRADFGELEDAGGAARCNCWYPNTNKYGVRNGDDCSTTDCWVAV